MNNRIIKFTFYVLIAFLASYCSSVGAKKLSDPIKTDEAESTQENNQFIEEVNQRIVDNKIDNAVTASSDNTDDLVLLKSKIKYLEAVISSNPGETTEIFNNPYSLFNQQIVMDNGTIYYGSVMPTFNIQNFNF